MRGEDQRRSKSKKFSHLFKLPCCIKSFINPTDITADQKEKFGVNFDDRSKESNESGGEDFCPAVSFPIGNLHDSHRKE